MEMRQVKYFVEIVERGSFGRASKSLAIAQPALSRQIRLLEESLGAPLLYRNGRGVMMTAAGEIFLAHAREILQRVKRAEHDVSAARGTPSGEVVVGLPPSVSAVLLRRIVVALAERYPLIRLRVQEGFSGNVAEWLLAGKVDLAIVYEHHRPQNAQAEQLLVEELPLVHSPSLILPPVVTSADLAGIPLVLPANPHGLRVLVEKRVAKHGGTLNVRFEMDSLVIMKELATEGVAATILPTGAVMREVEQGLLVVTPIVAPRIKRVMTLATATSRPLEKSHNAVIRIIREVAAEVQAGRTFSEADDDPLPSAPVLNEAVAEDDVLHLDRHR